MPRTRWAADRAGCCCSSDAVMRVGCRSGRNMCAVGVDGIVLYQVGEVTEVELNEVKVELFHFTSLGRDYYEVSSALSSY